MTTRYTSLQQLRGVAALLVVVAHTTEYPLAVGAPAPFWTGRLSELGVEIFFVISGFIITIVCGPARFNLKTFLWRRLVRVVPLYWICTTAVLALALTVPSIFKTTTGAASDYVLSLLFVPHAAQGDTLSNHWSPMLKPGWTLNLEMFFYLLVAALFWCPDRRLRSMIVTAVLGMLLVVRITVDTTRYGVLDFYANINFFAFVFGVWLAEANQEERSGNRRVPVVLLMTGGGAVLATIALFAMQGEPPTVPLAFPAAALMVFTAVEAERLGWLPTWPALTRIGDASYSLYLTHLFTLGLLWAAIRHLAPIQGYVHVIGVVVSVLAAVGVALLSYRLIERPFIRLAQPGRRLEPPAPHEAGANSKVGGLVTRSLEATR